MDALTLFGFASVAAMLLFYWLEQRDPRYVLAFALARFERLARKTADERDEVSGETFRRLPVRGMTNARVSGEA